MAKKSNLTPALQAAQASRKVESARRAKLTPDNRFKEDAGHRVNVVLKALGSISRFPSRATYTDDKGKEQHFYMYTPAQVEKMFSTIRAEVDRAESRYLVKQEGKKRGEGGFTF